MKPKFSCFLLLLFLPMAVFADKVTHHLSSATMEYRWLEGATQNTRHVRIDERLDGTFFVHFYHACRYGDCPASEFHYWYNCSIQFAGPEKIQVANKNQIIAQFQPEDCHVLVGGFTTAEFIFKADGRREDKHNYTDSHTRWVGPDGEQCFKHSNLGSEELRSATLEGIVDDTYFMHDTLIRFRVTADHVIKCNK